MNTNAKGTEVVYFSGKPIQVKAGFQLSIRGRLQAYPEEFFVSLFNFMRRARSLETTLKSTGLQRILANEERRAFFVHPCKQLDVEKLDIRIGKISAVIWGFMV